jgi:hypothetical protein
MHTAAATERPRIWCGSRTALLFLFAGIVAGPVSALAQDPTLSPGDRLRVVSFDRGDRPYTATLEAVRSDTLLLRRDRPGGYESVGLSLASIERLEVSVGTTSNAGKGALTGGIVGGALGLVIGIAAWAGSEEGDFLEVGPEAIPVSMAFLGGGGALLGTFIGALSSSDRRAPVRIESLRLGPVEGGVAFGASLAVGF